MNFDINRYLGLWHEIASIPSWFQYRLKNVTAQYSMIDSATIQVFNKGVGEVTGIQQDVKGTARIVSTSYTPLLKVKFFFGESDYKILNVSPNYEYALVGGGSPNFVWILSRYKTIPEYILAEYLRIAKANGYNINKLRFTKQD